PPACPTARVLLVALNATALAASLHPGRVTHSLLSPRSHSLTVPSQLPEVRVLPSGLKATEETVSACPFSSVSVCSLARFHNFSSPGLPGDTPPPAEARALPSGLNATEVTEPKCPLSESSSRPWATSHNRTVWSLPPETRILPSGLNATALTPAVCPFRMAHSCRVVTSHSRTVWSEPLAASVLPSGLNATAKTEPS